MTRPEVVLYRLRGGALDALVDLVLDDLLDRPAAEALDPGRVAASLRDALRTVAENPSLEQEIRERLESARSRARTVTTDLPRRLPPELQDAAEEALAWPFPTDRDLLLRMMDHAAMHSLIRDVLQDSLVRFARKLRSLAPEPGRLPGFDAARRAPGLGRLVALGSGVAAVGSAMAGALGSELEHQVDQRAREFATSAISVVLGQVVDTLTDPGRADAMAAWRLHALRAFLDTPSDTWTRTLDRVEPDRVADLVARTIRRLAARPELESELEGILRKGLDLLGSTTLRQQLDAAGLTDEWRARTREVLARTLGDLTALPAFERWLTNLLADEAKS